ncbi:lactate dehydrogenase-like 2-hydroxyacid dehydrogenase [Nocardioides sp. J9]|uniref:2-hydroxyacid dehydrogenase n=1 Tax=Nocardioides sp. J9 TaxID=935844 RepID=UPI0011AD7BE0|nr:2-hydroxyacid dehydrogenase [Nocardioides sp. J9]TWG96429.1 lactate dehydrogenase-like 2-hydroxyacid dehydrogenase [Nocardioides sp. J9]
MTRTGAVLRIPRLSKRMNEGLEASYDVLDLPDEGRDAFLAEHADRVVAIACTGNGLVDADLVAALPRLQVVVNHGVGYENVDVDACLAHGVLVSHTPGVLDDAVAETTLGLLIATRRRFVEADSFVRAGRWSQEGFPLTGQVAGSRVGILGLGRIGRRFAALVDAMGCEVAYHNRREVPGVPYRYAASATELAAGVDNLVVIVPGGASTAALVDREVLDALGPDGVLVNVARGSVVDEPALVAALQDGRLGAAGLDVFATEPHVPEELRAVANVVLLPHVASATVPTRNAMADLTLDNLALWWSTGRLRTPVPEMADEV